ncbi:MAG: ribonuclease T [Pseudomonadota bacterium]
MTSNIRSLHVRNAIGLMGLAMLMSVALADTGTAQRYDRRAPEAGVFDYYTLVLSWSPTFCAEEGNRRRSRRQCDPRDGRPYAFVLHGLWPQYERGFPNNCRIGRRPFVPNRVIDDMIDIMPARGLIIHQYRKHGTCSGLRPAPYFALARRLFDSIKIPQRFIAPRKPQTISPRDVIDEFIAANRGLRRDMMTVSCRRRSGNRMREVKICFTPDGQLRACGANEGPRRMCRADRMFVPPVRVRR